MEVQDLSVIKNRIDLIRQNEGLTLAEFAEAINVGRATMTHISQGRNNPSLEVIMKIISRFQNVNVLWLMKGIGNAYLDQSVENTDLPLFQASENGNSLATGQEPLKYATENEVKTPQEPIKETVKEVVKYIERPSRKITEIRIFFDDNTFEIFKSGI